MQQQDIANQESSTQGPNKGGFFSEVKSLTLIILLALLIRSLLVEIFYVPTGSMTASILEGDYVLATKYNYGFSRYSFPFAPPIFSGRIFANQPETGDVVIVHPPHNLYPRYVKRLVGLPGDKIEIIDNLLYINDQPIKREAQGVFTDKDGSKFLRFKETLPNGVSYFSYQPEKTNRLSRNLDHANFGPYFVESGRYFLLGDNRYNSADSRYNLGTVPFEDLIAKGQLIVFSTEIPLWKIELGIKEQVFRFWQWVKSIRLKRIFISLYE